MSDKALSLQNRLFAEFTDRDLYRQALDGGVAYLSSLDERPVYPMNKALDSLEIFEEELPVEFTPAQDVITRLEQDAGEATVAQLGGRYFGFVCGSAVPAGLAARVLSDFWDQNTAMQVLSPAAAKLEAVVESWLVDLFGLPSGTVAGFVSGTSMATFCALAAARYRLLERLGWDVNERGLSGAPPIRVIAGEQAHSTVVKAIGLLGFGRANVTWVDTDEQGRIRPDLIPDLDDRTLLILQAGNVNSGAFDDFQKLCGEARKAGAWVHVDGAFGYWAAASSELAPLCKGAETADSWSVDGHKTLNTPYDNGIVLCRDAQALTAALHMSGDYIVQGADRDGMFFTPEMSRRGRIFELWATLRSLGRRGLDDMVTTLHLRARQFAEELRAGGFEILNDVVFNQVVVFSRSSEDTQAILKDLQDQRVCWCGGSRWKNRDVIRISVCSWATTESDVRLSVDSFLRAKKHVEAQNG